MHLVPQNPRDQSSNRFVVELVCFSLYLTINSDCRQLANCNITICMYKGLQAVKLIGIDGDKSDDKSDA